MIDVHLNAPVRILRAAQPIIAENAKREIVAHGSAQRRTAVNISSVAGLGGNGGQVGYAAGKMGILGVTKTLMKEWGHYNVTVNAVAFGSIATRMTAGEAGKSTITVKGRLHHWPDPRRQWWLVTLTAESVGHPDSFAAESIRRSMV